MLTPTHMRHSSSPGMSKPRWQVMITFDPSLILICRRTQREKQSYADDVTGAEDTGREMEIKGTQKYGQRVSER